MIVMKFGGTSVGNSENIAHVADIVKSYIEKKPVVVVSAVGGVTDKLIDLCNRNVDLDQIKKIHSDILEKLNLDKSLLEKDFEALTSLVSNNKEVDAKVLDEFQSFGEQMSSKIVAVQLNKIGIEAQAFNSWDLGFLTNSDFGNAGPLEETFTNLDDNITKLDVVPVITGFIGKTKKGEITTIGRGGSDYTAGIIGVAINADEIQIWTDVDGIMSADPKIVSNAKTLVEVSFAEASELAYFGARVLHPKTIAPAMQKNIPVRVLNTFEPGSKGTIILSKAEKSNQIVKAVSYKKGITLINIGSTRMLGSHGFLARIFNIFEKNSKSIDMIATSEVSVSLTIDNEQNIDTIVRELKKIAKVKVLKNRAIVCIVGEGMKHTQGVSGRTFTALGNKKINIEMISQGASEINITFVVDGKDAEDAVKVLHEEYFE